MVLATGLEPAKPPACKTGALPTELSEPMEEEVGIAPTDPSGPLVFKTSAIAALPLFRLESFLDFLFYSIYIIS